MKITNYQGELVNLLYANIKNANIYCDALISDKQMPVESKNSVLRPMHVHLKFLKKALDGRIGDATKNAVEDLFNDSMVYDEVIRMMVHLSPEARLEVEAFIKKKFAEDLL